PNGDPDDRGRKLGTPNPVGTTRGAVAGGARSQRRIQRSAVNELTGSRSGNDLTPRRIPRRITSIASTTMSATRWRRSQPGLTRRLKITDVQWILGHAQLTTTQLYLAAPAAEVIESALDHLARMSAQAGSAPSADPALPAYRPQTLDILF